MFPALKAEMSKMKDTFADRFNKREVDKLADMFTGDAMLLPPDFEMLRGKGGKQSLTSSLGNKIQSNK